MSMTDEQIVEALEIISTTANCNECAFYSGKVCNCSQVTAIQSLDLIKRQQAEIEDLKADKEALINGQLTIQKMYIEARDKAVREFAEKLKEKATSTYYEERKYVDTEDIDELVKEMTEKEGGKE